MSYWMLSNPGKTVTIYNIPSFVKDVSSQSLSQSNVLSGFSATSIHPYNPNIFKDDDFLCSSVTDREITMEPQIMVDVPLETSVSAEEETLQGQATTQVPVVPLPSDGNQLFSVLNSSFASNEQHTENLSANLSEEPTPSTSMIILPEVIRPYPKSGPRKTIRRKRQPRNTKILTETPEKTDNRNENKKIKLIATQTKRREKQHKTKKSVGGLKTKISKSKKLSVKSNDSDTDAED
nr:unnamed protein product [Callosobruchus analis]